MPTLDHVICPVDLSECSASALSHAVAWARWYDADLQVLHVVSLPITVPGPGGGIVMTTTHPPLSAIRADVEHLLARIPHDGVSVSLQIVEGDPAETILREFRRQPHSLLVMGSHGRSWLDRLINGSVAETVAHRAPGAVLIVPAHDGDVPRELPRFERILCAVDFGPSSLAGLRHALWLAQQVDAELHVLHLLETAGDDRAIGLRNFSVPEHQIIRHRDARDELRKQIPDEARPWCKVQEEVLAGHPATDLLKRAEDIRADLIVMGSGDRFHLRSLWLGGATNRVIQAAHVPALIVPPPESSDLEPRSQETS